MRSCLSFTGRHMRSTRLPINQHSLKSCTLASINQSANQSFSHITKQSNSLYPRTIRSISFVRTIHSTSHESQPPTSEQPISQPKGQPSSQSTNQSSNQSSNQSNQQSSNQSSQSSNQGPRRPNPHSHQRHHQSNNQQEDLSARNNRTLKYALAVALLTLGASYAAVPLYRIFCQRTGYGGTTQVKKSYDALGKDVSDREIVITFMADVSPSLHWSFTPVQQRLRVRVGEPVLAFYQATNHRDKAVTGVATYNVTPMKTGFYFNKIQCFCFDEQRLRAGETVDMPVFFFIDPAINEDKRCDDVDDITLSYTFFPIDDDEDEDKVDDQEGHLSFHQSPEAAARLAALPEPVKS